LFSDELGTPFAVTIDFRTLEDRSVTIRERDSTQQIRVQIEQIVPILSRLIHQSEPWKAIYETNEQVTRADE
jgi:glycyl-tRNA synthetase